MDEFQKLKPAEYIETRLNKQKEYFSKNSGKNKKGYENWSVFKLSCSLAITVISPYSNNVTLSSIPLSFIVTLLAAAVALSEGILLLRHYYENWMNYRTSNERLKKEEMLYRTGTGEYRGKKDEAAFDMFVQNVENIVEDSNGVWKKTAQNVSQNQTQNAQNNSGQ